ncbi:MAG: biotin/lipoyl-containing protein [bacterium]
MRLELRAGDRELPVDVTLDGENYTVTVAGEQLPLELLAAHDGEIDLRLDGKRYRAHVASRGDERLVFISGRVFSFSLPSELDETGEADSAGGPNIVSQMPCTIVKLLVEPGQVVAAGDSLLIVESMKMETEITAPVAGSVTTVHVQTGETIGMDAPMIDIEPAPSAEDDSPSSA